MINELAEVNRNQAMRALTASSEPLAGVQIVRGTMAGGLPFPWRLDAAITLLRTSRDIAAIFWDADAPGLALVDHTGQIVYRFTTVDPFEIREPGPAPTVPGRRADLRIVRPAS